MGGGNDRVSLSNVLVAGPISINAGEGNDVVRLGDEAMVSTRQNLTIDLGAGDDVLHMQRVYIAGDITADGGAGNDVMLAIGVAGNSQSWLGSSSSGATTVRGGDGDDSIQAIFSFVVGPWKIEGVPATMASSSTARPPAATSRSAAATATTSCRSIRTTLSRH